MKNPSIIPLFLFSLLLILSCSGDLEILRVGEEEYSDAVEEWANIFEPSVLTYEERLKELEWFEYVSSDLQGIKIQSTAENIETHYWESQFLSKAFKDITGIEVNHHIQGEGDVVLKMMDQIENNNYHYDIYVNDADMVGTHLRMNSVVNLSEYMNREGWQYTNPFLDLDDFLNLSMGQDYEGNQLQLPDQQFANLYWFRYDWFKRRDIQKLFREQYGYELGVPLNWSAYEDIAEFFTNNPIDGNIVYGHLDYGKPSPSLGWRFTDSWMAMAGVGDKGLPNGLPVDEWGIRVEDKIPKGSSVSRGGAVNSPAAIYAVDKYVQWLHDFAPPESFNWEWVDAGPRASSGDIAQRIFQYTTWLSHPDFHNPSSPVTDSKGIPNWRVAPSPLGKYWEEGMKSGYQDCGSWTIPQNVRGKKRAAAWLWAQFCISKTVSLKKFLIGMTPVRKSTIDSNYLTQNMDNYGGLIEFYRSSVQLRWTDSGPNVPYYEKLSSLWWRNIADVIEGNMTSKEALDRLAAEQDEVMESLNLLQFNPQLNPEISNDFWLEKEGSPKREKPDDELPRTISYETLIREWRRNR